MIFNSLMSLADVVTAYENLLTKSSNDPNFSSAFINKLKIQKKSPMEELMDLIYHQTHVANPAFHGDDQKGMCRNKLCDEKRPATHTPSNCYAVQVQKYLYLQACYWVYENKFLTETQRMIF